MSLIQQALYRLDHAVESLEGSLHGLEKTMAGQQRDMFAAPAKPAKAGQIAKRLDRTIERVEKLLGER